MQDFDLDKFLPYRLSVVASRVSRDFATEYQARFGFSIAEWRVMAHLAHAPNVSVRDIHERADLEKSKASRAVTRLEAAGLVNKLASGEDRRLLVLSLTPKGQAVMDELIPVALAFEKNLLSRLTPDDRATLDRIIKQLSVAEKAD